MRQLNNTSWLSLIGLSILLMVGACRTKPVQPENYPQPQIRFGSGGGFTGFVRQYALLNNGHLYLQQGADSTFSFIDKLSNKQTRALFRAVPSVLLEETFHHPGNRYYFVEYHQPNQINRHTWGDNQYLVNDSLKNFYSRLQRLVPTAKP